jgi:hypothetical protein
MVITSLRDQIRETDLILSEIAELLGAIDGSDGAARIDLSYALEYLRSGSDRLRIACQTLARLSTNIQDLQRTQ